jgi:hypothetical protein
MMRVPCEVSEEILTNDDGIDVPGVVVSCSRCDHETESFGTSDRSVKRYLVLMREECPNGEDNFYTSDEPGA